LKRESLDRISTFDGHNGHAIRARSRNGIRFCSIPLRYEVGRAHRRNLALDHKGSLTGEETVQILTQKAFLRVREFGSDMKVLQLRDLLARASVLIRTSNVIGKVGDNARLVFNQYGEQYFFAQLWLPGDNTGMSAQKSEKATSRELAAVKRATKVVALTAKR